MFNQISIVLNVSFRSRNRDGGGGGIGRGWGDNNGGFRFSAAVLNILNKYMCGCKQKSRFHLVSVLAKLQK